jgi:DNA-directed RNA polymerase subunit beta
MGHHDPGVVTDVVWGRNGPVVLVKSQSRMQVGDKLSGRYGDKGVVSAIVPDDQMPHGKDGKPFEILLSPDGTITRTNPSQELEAGSGRSRPRRASRSTCPTSRTSKTDRLGQPSS